MPDTQVEFKDFTEEIPVITILNGGEKLAGIDSDGNEGSISPDVLADYIGGGVVKFVKVTLSAAQIKGANDASVVLVPAQGSGKAIVPLYPIRYKKVFNSTAFITNLNVQLFNGTLFQRGFSAFLDFSSSFNGYINSVSEGESGGNSGDNVPLTFFVTSGNPATGDGQLIFWIAYIVIDL